MYIPRGQDRREKRIDCLDTGESFLTYREYLKSDHCAMLKERHRASKLPHCCAVCGRKNGPFDFHHRTYKRIGREWLMDVVPLCRSCHDVTHRIHKSSQDSRTNLWNSHKKARRAVDPKNRVKIKTASPPESVLLKIKDAHPRSRNKVLVDFFKAFCAENGLVFDDSVSKRIGVITRSLKDKPKRRKRRRRKNRRQ